MGSPCKGEALSNPPATWEDPGRAETRLWKEGWWQMCGKSTRAGCLQWVTLCCDQSSFLLGDGPVLGMEPDQTGQAAPDKGLQQSSAGHAGSKPCAGAQPRR